MYKYVHNDLPFTLLLNIFQYSHQIHEHDTRYSNEPRPYKCRTQTVYFVTDQNITKQIINQELFCCHETTQSSAAITGELRC